MYRTLTAVVPPALLQLAKLNVEAQRVERELRDELANSVSREASDADRARIGELEKAEAELRVEVSRCADGISPRLGRGCRQKDSLGCL